MRMHSSLAFVASVIFSLVAAESEVLQADDECDDGDEGQCAFNALQSHGQKLSESLSTAQSTERTACAALSDPVNANCKDVVAWAAKDGKWDPHAHGWYNDDMMLIAAINYTVATPDDWQKLFFCAPPGGKQCGAPPCQCSKPPCGVCLSNLQIEKKPGCENGAGGIHCTSPPTALEHSGKAWPDMTVSGSGPFHAFALGDWGGMDGTLKPVEGRASLNVYDGGDKTGPSAFPRTRFNIHHTVELCDHTQFLACYNGDATGCPDSCGFVKGLDDQPQLLVAYSMKVRAAKKDPFAILNVGDNFYWGGIEKTCGTPMDQLSYTAYHQFEQIFEGVYNGPGLDGKPWLSVLGNHDWGGRVFNNGWDQQIAYTWYSKRWVMPAPYFSQHVEFPDAGFSVDIFMVDTNALDAHAMDEDPDHNICGGKHNARDATCVAAGGPTLAGCHKWFMDMWDRQKKWLPEKLDASTADWQVAVTHFPCGSERHFWMSMHQQHGLDLLATGHRHDQELWEPKRLGGLTCFVTGGGGGISSEATPNAHNKKDWYGEAQYGFYDIMFTKENLEVTSINWNGYEIKSATVYPKKPGSGPDNAGGGCAAFGCKDVFVSGRSCQCNRACARFNSCCADHQAVCVHR